MSDDEDAIRMTNDSGYPLQIAVGHSVAAATREHGWTVRYTEHSWNGIQGGRGFIDLVLQDWRKSTYLVVECERVRDTTWLFMHEDGKATGRRHAKAWVSREQSGGRLKCFDWRDTTLDPSSPEAVFCAIRGQSAGDRSTLIERIGGELISATEAFAYEEKDFHSSDNMIRFYFNVIVTTARLKLATFALNGISLTDGMLASAIFHDVPFLRFRKQMSERGWDFTPEDYENNTDPAYEKESTVFVVRATALHDFLKEFELSGDTIRKFE